MVKRKAFILGAGMAGLVAGKELAAAEWDVCVLEATDSAGGLAKTFRYDDYYVDAGPHLFHTSSTDIASYWEASFPGEFLFPSLYGGNYIDGKIFDYPLTVTSLEQLAPEVAKSARAELEHGLRDDVTSSASNYKEYIVDVAGPVVQSIFYEDYPQKLWGVPTNELSANWAPRRIAFRRNREPFHGSQWCGISKLGCGRIADLLVEQVRQSGGEILLQTPVTGLQSENGAIARIETESLGFEVGPQDIVISTLPITVLAGFLGVPCELDFRNIKLVSLVHEGPEAIPEPYDWLYFRDPSLVFHRVGSQTKFSRHGIAPGLSILTAEIAYSSGDSVDLMSHTDLVERVNGDLQSVGIDLTSSLRATHVNNLGPVYPGYKVGFESELKVVETEVQQVENLYSLGSLAEFAYSDLQIIFAKSLDLAARVSGKGDTRGYIRKARRRTNKFSSSVSISGRVIGPDFPPYTIAEIGLNHNGSVESACRLIDAAVSAGFDAVKLQSFLPGRASAKVEDALYKEDLLDLEENLSQMFSRLSLTSEQTREIFDYARSRSVVAFSTPFDSESVDVLLSLNVPAFKISSMDLTNLDLIREVASTMLPVILSTGMASIGEIDEALEIFREVGNSEVVVLHCLSSYPASAPELNLRAVDTIQRYFGVVTGFSDHSSTNVFVPAAIALGARVIEKHVTLDRRQRGPDHLFSLEPVEMEELTRISREAFYALGDGYKRVMPSEFDTAKKLRRSVFAATDIERGEIITRSMLTVKSPGTGLEPKFIDIVVGRPAKMRIERDFPITWDLV